MLNKTKTWKFHRIWYTKLFGRIIGAIPVNEIFKFWFFFYKFARSLPLQSMIYYTYNFFLPFLWNELKCMFDFVEATPSPPLTLRFALKIQSPSFSSETTSMEFLPGWIFFFFTTWKRFKKIIIIYFKNENIIILFSQ